MEITYKKIITEEDVDQACELYRSNPGYFQLVSGKIPTRQNVIDDMHACPPGTSLEKKKYGIYLLDGMSVAVTDVLEGFPDADTYYIGLFLVDGNRHREGLGRVIYQEMERQARELGFQKMRLGVVDTNHKARAFWQAMGFCWVKTVESTLHEGMGWTVEIAEKSL